MSEWFIDNLTAYTTLKVLTCYVMDWAIVGCYNAYRVRLASIIFYLGRRILGYKFKDYT